MSALSPPTGLSATSPPAELSQAFARAKAEQAAKLRSDPAAQKKKAAEEATEFRIVHGLFVGFLLWIVALHGAGIFLFTKGFLLTRNVLENISECEVIPGGGGSSPDTVVTQGCWRPKKFDKAVVVIIDALRFDFTQPYEGDSASHFHNVFTTPYKMSQEHPENSVLLPFIADPPTTTLQRLKGLTTGTLPTFIDAGSNFAGNAIEEDNLILQLRRQGKRIAFLGDDTWMALFPDKFERDLTHPYDSLNVWDLHTVDNGVNEHIYPLLEKGNSTKWDVLIGHYLGVDHAGHRYGPDHPAMAAKLKQMDETVTRVAEQIDDNTLLIVMGDHGMDPKGDHGGESWGELEAAIWMYSKRPFFGRLPTPEIAEQHQRSVQQIDLVPTLALLLGLPIPYNNLGGPIAEAFLGPQSNDWENLAEAARVTAHQVERYHKEYSGEEQASAMETIRGQKAFAIGEEKYAAIKESQGDNWYEIFTAYEVFQKESLRACRDAWATFDLTSMSAGIAILLGAVAVLVTFARGLSGNVMELTAVLFQKAAMGMGCGVAFTAVTSSFIPWGLPRAYISIIGASAGSIIGFLHGAFFSTARVQSIVPNDIWGFTSLVFTILHSVLFGSNSFTIWEDQILTFLLATFGVLALVYSRRNEEKVQRALGTYHSIAFLILTRLASTSRLCREEQMPFCQSTFYASATSSVSSVSSLTLLTLTAIALPSIISSFYRGTRSFEGPALFWIGIVFRLSLILTAVYWFIDSADNGSWFPSWPESTLKTSKTLIAQIVLVMGVIAGTIGYAWSQVCVNVDVISPETVQSRGTSGVVRAASGDTVVILGYANMHGSRYFLLVAAWSIVFILVQKPLGGVSLAILLWQILSLSEIIDVLDLRASAIGPVILGLLGSSHFFSTGHQATLPAIQWESAFIPFKTIVYPWSPLLVIANTIGPQLLTALSVPLLTLWKQPPKTSGLLSLAGTASATHMLYHTVVTLASVFCAGHLRRHLMLYKIFAPRYMLGSVVLLGVDVMLVVIGVAGLRWNFGAVAEVFGWVY